MSRILLAKLDARTDLYQYLNAKQKADKELWVDSAGQITPGVYLVKAKVEWLSKYPEEFVLSVYGKDKVDISIVEKKNLPANLMP